MNHTGEVSDVHDCAKHLAGYVSCYILGVSKPSDLSFENRKYLRQDTYPHPHIGKMMRAKMRERGLTLTDVGRMLGVNHTVVARYFRQSSVQFGILWKIGLALQHNFLAELIDPFPHPAPPGTAAAQAVAGRDARIADLEKSLTIYKEVLAMGKGA